MRKTITFCLFSCLIANVAIAAQAATRRGDMSFKPAATVPQSAALSAEQMDNLLAPIALYPDPLLAQMFPASTFVDQIDQAARWLRGNNNKTEGVDNQSWDVSVKSVAHYPPVVYSMSEKLDWTTALGQAYVNQSADVLKSVQRLRKRAKAAGFLVTTSQQTVIVEQEVIKVVPAQPQVIYVPTYNPQVVYVQPSGPSTGSVVAATAISFGVGLAIGAWLNNDCNWHSHTVYYHGWHGAGWVSTSSRYVRTSSVYVNNRYSTVHVNSAVVHRNVNYNNVNHYNNVNRNVNYNNVNVNNVNRNNVNVNNVNRNNVNTNNINRNNVNTNNVNHNNVASKNINTNDARINSMRGQANAGAGTTSRAAQPTQQRTSAFGGFGGSGQTRAASERGQASRASAQQSRSLGGGRGRSGGGGRRR